MVPCMLRSCLMILVCSVFSVQQHAAVAEEFGFQYAGLVVQAFGAPYGYTVPGFTPTTGRFVYETNTGDPLPIAGCGDCAAYVHQQINGFSATFSGLHLRADEYVIEVRNNVEVIGVGMADVFSVLYPGISGLDLDAPLLANGVAQAAGQIRVDFIGNTSVFADSSLPAELDPADFNLMLGVNVMGDEVPANAPDLLFALQTLSAVPLLESDHDLDGDVDGRDFLIWQRNHGTANCNGDANSDNLVDGVDLGVWHTQYGSFVSPLVAAVAVPEPYSLTLMGAMLLTCVSRRR